MQNCKICKHNIIETKYTNIYVCTNCFHIENLENNINIELGNICIFNNINEKIIWIDAIEELDKPDIVFEILKNLNITENIYIKIELFYINNQAEIKYKKNYFNVNSLKIFCELNDFNIIDIYQVKNKNEIFHIFKIKGKDEENMYNCINLYECMYEELINNVYNIYNYIN